MTAVEALIRLLSIPDPPEMGRRGYRYTQFGDTLNRDQIKRDLGTAFVQWQRQCWTGGDTSSATRVHRLKLVRRA